jgi:glycosyltransferase involved in cell wall biosynthesis
MISVVVPTTNEKKGLHSLKSAKKILGANMAEAILVLDNSSYESESFVVTEGLKVRVVRICGLNGSYFARNQGAVHAKCDFLLFLDDGLDIEGEFDCGSLTPQVAFGASVKYRKAPVTAFEKWYFYKAFDIDGFIKRDHFIPTIFLFVSRQVFFEVGCFNSAYKSSGDVEFCSRLVRSDVELRKLNTVSVVTDLRNKSQIERKIRRQVFGQMIFSKNKGMYRFYVYNFKRLIANLLLLSGASHKNGLDYLYANSIICYWKVRCLLQGLLQPRKLDSYLTNANVSEVNSDI